MSASVCAGTVMEGANPMSDMIRRFLAVAFVAVFGLGVSACNTFDGLGKDLNDAGKAIGLVDDENTN